MFKLVLPPCFTVFLAPSTLVALGQGTKFQVAFDIMRSIALDQALGTQQIATTSFVQDGAPNQ